MDIRNAQNRLPDGALIYREYEALLPNGLHVAVAITLDALWAEPDIEIPVSAGSAMVHGHVVLLDANEREPPMTWTCDGIEIQITATPPIAAPMQSDLRDAIGVFVVDFLDKAGHEIEVLLGRPSAVH